MKQTERFLTWLKEDYLSEEKILAAYNKETAKQRETLRQYYIDQMREKLSPCNGCSSYATCHRPTAQICQKAAQFNDTIRALAKDFVEQQEKKAMLTAEEQLEAIKREIDIANLADSDKETIYVQAIAYIQNIINPYKGA